MSTPYFHLLWKEKSSNSFLYMTRKKPFLSHQKYFPKNHIRTLLSCCLNLEWLSIPIFEVLFFFKASVKSSFCHGPFFSVPHPLTSTGIHPHVLEFSLSLQYTQLYMRLISWTLPLISHFVSSSQLPALNWNQYLLCTELCLPKFHMLNY
jgi:hypothetical protein